MSNLFSRRVVGVFLLLMIFAGVPSALLAQDQRITDIRFWQSPEEAQIVLDLTWFPKVSPVQTLSDGTLFFDIENGNFRPGRQTYPLNNVFISAVTVQERANGAIRVYFKVPAGVQFRTFLLPKTPPSKPDRIVIFLSEPVAAQSQRREDERAEIGRLKAQNVKIVVIDPGHGGEDPGCRHNNIIEKDYVLAMGKLVKAYFDRDPKYRAVLTRTGDYIIPLQKRSQVAEHLGADAFVSVHANYNRKRSIQGIEVYYESQRGAMGAMGEAERQIADVENSQDEIGGVALPTGNKAEIVEKQASIMFKSRQFAEKIEGRMGVAVPGLISRGVKRAGFKVLHSVQVPSALLELGYTSNPTDAWLLKDPNARQRLAQSIYLGIKDFLEGQIHEGRDEGYIQYVAEVEAEKRAKAERARQQRERRARLMRNSKSYKARSGDTVQGVAAKFNVSVSDLKEINSFGKRKKLKAGENVRIPGGK